MPSDSLDTSLSQNPVIGFTQPADSSIHPVDSIPCPFTFDTTLDTARADVYKAYIYTANHEQTQPAVILPDWHDGLQPQQRTMQPGNRSGFLLIIALMAVIMTFNFRHLSRVLKTYCEEIWNVRRGRDNVFDDHTASDTRLLILLVIQSIVSSGILLTSAICRISGNPMAGMTGLTVTAVIGVMAAAYIFRLVAYNIVGYTFSDAEGRREWIRGFNASQAILGVALVIPAALVIFYPEISYPLVVTGIFLYIIALVMFVYKGFRIFFDKISSLIYFILYLCTLEIIPLLIVGQSARFIVDANL